MSRDFELLQRLEQGWNRSLNLLSPLENEGPRAKPRLAAGIAQTIAAGAVRPSIDLAPAIRHELIKLIFRTSLSTPAIRALMFTGVTTQEGAKWVTACTADILADATQDRVCLLDADIASPTVHYAYSTPNQNGLAAILRGRCTVGEATLRISDNLWIIPAGTTQSEPLVTSPIFQEVVTELMEQFEYLIISAPGCDQLVELSAVGGLAEGTILVLDALKTRRAAAKEAKAALDIAKVRVLGSVLTRHSSSIPEVFSTLP